ncbi:DUF4136 domain-containing protein [Uliginosibacterium sp. H1]|uniref:DUF4136 domain-containing protein n=1 Tax=Uliginosibacterium sp. H1 TaxID=3114757 RepID=UPI002E16BFD4|nr:DUF4136 domain-containing protein [Uliginosibacterium sp. H1]
MNVRRKILVTAMVLAGGLTLGACSTFSLGNAWRAPDFAGPPMKNVLVLGVSNSDASRRIFEDGMSQALKAAGVGATHAYATLPEGGRIADEKIKAAVAQTKADSVLITRLLRVDQKAEVTQPVVAGGYYRAGFYGWYGSAWGGMPASVSTYNVLTLETTLWDTRKESLIWSATTEAIQPSDIAKATQDMAKVLIERMKKDGVI